MPGIRCSKPPGAEVLRKPGPLGCVVVKGMGDAPWHEQEAAGAGVDPLGTASAPMVPAST